jgi:ABC-type polysaccharide/polyol phosphate export permease
MIVIEPAMKEQVIQVLICLLWTTIFAVLVSAAVSSLFSRTAAATTTTYIVLVGLCVGTMLVWFGSDARFGHDLVERVLSWNPMAAALRVMEAPGFREYNLVPANWYIISALSVVALAVLVAQMWRLSRPR